MNTSCGYARHESMAPHPSQFSYSQHSHQIAVPYSLWQHSGDASVREFPQWPVNCENSQFANVHENADFQYQIQNVCLQNVNNISHDTKGLGNGMDTGCFHDQYSNATVNQHGLGENNFTSYSQYLQTYDTDIQFTEHQVSAHQNTSNFMRTEMDSKESIQLLPSPRLLDGTESNQIFFDNCNRGNPINKCEQNEVFIHETKDESEFHKPKDASGINNVILPPCRICGATASGFHYGVNSCEACKGFFRRALKRPIIFYCTKNRQCDVKGNKRSSCRFCRYKRCLRLGMSREAIKTGRYSHKKRTSDTIEVKQLQNSPSLDNSELEVTANDLFTAHDSLLQSSTQTQEERIYKRQLEYHNIYLLHKKFGDHAGLRQDNLNPLNLRPENQEFSNFEHCPESLEGTKQSSPSPSSSQISSDSGYSDDTDLTVEGTTSKCLDKNEEEIIGYLDPLTQDYPNKMVYPKISTSCVQNLTKTGLHVAENHHEIDVVQDLSPNMDEDIKGTSGLSESLYNKESFICNINQIPTTNEICSKMEGTENLDVKFSNISDTNVISNVTTIDLTHDEYVSDGKTRNPVNHTSSHASTRDVVEHTIPPRLTTKYTVSGNVRPKYSVLTPENSPKTYFRQNDHTRTSNILSGTLEPSASFNSSPHLKTHDNAVSTETRNDTSCATNSTFQLPLKTMKMDVVKSDTSSEQKGKNHFQISTDYMRRTEKWIKGYIKFAQRIPGFASLTTADQSALLSHAWDEVWMLGAYRGYNSELSVAHMPCGKCYHVEEMEKGWGKKYVHLSFEIADILKGQNLTPQLLVLLKAISIVSPDRCQLDDHRKVESIHWLTVTCLLHHIEITRPGDHVTFPRLVSILTSLRALDESARRTFDNGRDHGMYSSALEAFTPF